MHYVYEIYNSYGSVVWVGETKRKEGRRKEQVGRPKSPFSGDAFIIVAEFNTRKEALKLEDDLKKQYGLERHEHNRNLKASKHAKTLGKQAANGGWLKEYQLNAGQRAKQDGSLEKMIDAARIANTDRPNIKNQKLTKKEVEEIKRLYATGQYTQRGLAEMFGVSQHPIKLIVNNKDTKHRQ